jgi:hypothetical protein
VQTQLIAIASIVAVTECAQAQTTPLKAARLTIDGPLTRHVLPRAAKSSRTGPSTSVTTMDRLKRWCCSVATGPSPSG